MEKEKKVICFVVKLLLFDLINEEIYLYLISICIEFLVLVFFFISKFFDYKGYGRLLF